MYTSLTVIFILSLVVSLVMCNIYAVVILIETCGLVWLVSYSSWGLDALLFVISIVCSSVLTIILMVLSLTLFSSASSIVGLLD